MKRKDFWVQQRQHSLFPPSLFFVYLGVLLLMSGLHTGLLVGMDELGWPSWIQVLRIWRRVNKVSPTATAPQ